MSLIYVDVYGSDGYRISRELLTRVPVAGEYIVLKQPKRTYNFEPYQVWRVMHIVGMTPRIQLMPGPIDTEMEADWFLLETVWPDTMEKKNLNKQEPTL